MTQGFSLFLFLLFVVATGSAIGLVTAPGAWYGLLNKPTFTPPGWLFGPVWTLLYIMIAVTGWRLWTIGGSAGLKLLWMVQMVLNFFWSPVFFGAQKPLLALAVILALLLAILMFLVVAWRQDRLSLLLFLPYGLWVGFATALNAAIVSMN